MMTHLIGSVLVSTYNASVLCCDDVVVFDSRKISFPFGILWPPFTNPPLPFVAANTFAISLAGCISAVGEITSECAAGDPTGLT